MTDRKRGVYKMPRGRPKAYTEVEVMQQKIKKIHRLVAEAFIDNPNNYLYINHKDENKKNNIVNNLEWCTKAYNNNYGTRNERMSKNKSKYKIIQKDKEGKIIKKWQNIWDLEHNTSYNKWVIRQCCKNKCKTVYGYKWEYELQKKRGKFMDNYIRYTYYDDIEYYIAIINKDTPNEVIKKLQEEYDEVKYKE